MPLSNGRFLGSVPVQAALRRRLASRAHRGCWTTSAGLVTNLVTNSATNSATSPLVTHSACQQRRGHADAAGSHHGHHKVDLLALDQKWQAKWVAAAESASSDTSLPSSSFSSSSATSPRPFKYVLPMFPYPSGNLHLGHLRVYAIADVVARFYRLQGHDVLLPMGWDSFGLPAENAARERGVQPATWTRANIERMRAQLDRMNGSWDWSRQLSTCEPDFYKHTQRLFLLLHKRGLAYQAEAEVNYDPVDQTVLANEQVDAQGRSWRSGAVVEKRRLKQWFLRISAYREALLADLAVLAENDAWPERVLAMQRHWLGRSTGALVKFPLLAYGQGVPSALEVYTTRIDTLLGVQYVALAASHPVVQTLAQSDPELQAFLDTLPALPPDAKVGYLLPHLRAINPLAYHDSTPDAAKESLPVYVAPYVLGDYGEGAVMGVPGHDVRDHAFWRQHRGADPVRFVLAASEDEATTVLDVDKDDKTDDKADNTANGDAPYVGHGYMTAHSGPFQGRPSQEAGAQLLAMLEAAGLATATERWRLRDWLVSRQRYWGAPIPIIHCDRCGAVPVPETDLPVTLPDVEPHFAAKDGGNPLASPAAADWAHVPCPSCHGPAKRDTDTMDTFVDSSWYYMRFVDPHNADAPFAADKAVQNLPVDLYLGGIEHAILHLLYARFIYKVLMTSELVGAPPAGESQAATDTSSSTPIHEPFARLITQGMVHGKTLVDPDTGRYLLPSEVDTADDPARPIVRATGRPAAVAYEKMSKSKHNGVDPTDTIARHGADATRAHMLFQAPVADVLNWDEDKITGVTRWLGRVHDLVVALPEVDAKEAQSTTSVADDLKARRSNTNSSDMARWDADAAVWREVQTTIASVTASYTRIYALNTVVSDLMRLSNTLVAAQEAGVVTPSVLRAAVSAVVRMVAPITPAFAEECWSRLEPSSAGLFGSTPNPAAAPNNVFPREDGSAAWLQPRLQNCAVQINGKLRCAVDIPRAPADLQGQALGAWLADAVLATDEGRARLAGDGRVDIRQAKKTIVVRNGKLVNFVF
ncbi:leucyl-tRNA synthetase [Sporothrix schenckii 1099-18]|uniref:leucine--tRNA ligase n=2 Tax=Sporothrix schenckii TaxID=29908 RepID=U7PLE7_SPOS1|nr:leucyl-tRNA synthetase [Sporothrix schenckii 1099-18]ERS95554.1 leucine-tRNA ligase [Sporothrix schenckii ATCC 58251]KJR86739.1 leucyl-tRNA synthetase [Sporothrix schenckii 1099-18]